MPLVQVPHKCGRPWPYLPYRLLQACMKSHQLQHVHLLSAFVNGACFTNGRPIREPQGKKLTYTYFSYSYSKKKTCRISIYLNGHTYKQCGHVTTSCDLGSLTVDSLASIKNFFPDSVLTSLLNNPVFFSCSLSVVFSLRGGMK